MGKKLTTHEFVNRSVQIHGSTYNYSLTEYVNANTKVKIVCPVHGLFSQWPSDHSRGSGCALCNERQQLTVQQFVDRATQLHNSKYTYDRVTYKNVTTKVDMSCPSHGIFSQTPKDHMTGYGCPECGGTKKKSTADFVALAKATHGDKYSYRLVDLKSMNKKVELICPDHGNFFQRPADHVAGSGCPECGKRKQGGYTMEYFNNHPETKTTPAKLYLIEIDGKFCKVGITTKEYVKQRFPGMRFQEHAHISASLYDAFCKEQQILQQFSHLRYQVQDLKHTTYQTGWTECFPLSLLPELKTAMEKING